MPGYQYRGAIRDTGKPWPKPERKPADATKPALVPCGTTGAYRRHRKNGEPIDDLCREANAESCRRWRQKRRKEQKVYG